MRNRVLLAICLALICTGGRMYAAEAPHVSRVDMERAAIASGIKQAQSGDLAGAAEALSGALANPAFRQLSAEEQYHAYALLGAILHEAKDPSALAALKMATQSPYAQENDWHLRLDAAYRQGDYRDAVTSLTAIAQHWPDQLSSFNDTAMFRLANLAPKLSARSAVDLLGALHAAHWRPTDTFNDPDYLWYKLAVAEVEVGDEAAAVAALHDVNDAGPIVEVLADKRFDAIVARDPGHFRIEQVLEDDISRSRFLAEAAPKQLAGAVGLASDLIYANRAGEALSLLDRTIDRALPSEGAPSEFDDYAREISWAVNERARALFVLGRDQEGLVAYERSVRMPVVDGSNVGQILNFADALVSAGKPRDALDLLAPFEPATTNDYGRLVAAKVRACAYAALGSKALLERELDYARAHADTSVRQYLDALVCADDADGAAHVLIAELRDPMNRGDALSLLQDYVVPPGEAPVDRERRLRFLAVRGRADVAAAIARVGRVSSYALLYPEH